MNTAIRSRAMAPVLSRLAEIAAIVAQKVWRFLTAGHAATLPQYRPRRSRGRVFMRHSLLLAAVLGIAVVYGFLFTILPPFLYVYMAVPIGVLALAVIWALPDSDVYPAGVVRFLFFALVLAIGLWPNYLALALPGQPWISSRRLFTIPLFVLFLISYSMSPALRADLKGALATSKPLWVAMLIYIFLSFATIFVSDYPATSFNRFLVAQLEWTLPFLVAVWLFQQPRHAMWVAGALLIVVSYQSIIGVWEHAIQAVPWAPYVPTWLKGDIELVDRILSGARRWAVGTHRSAGTWSTPLSYAEFLALLSAFLIHFVFVTRKVLYKFLVGGVIVCCVASIIYSQSRLGLIGFIGVLIMYVLVFAVRKWLQDKNSIMSAAILMAYPFFALTIVGLTFVSRRLELMVWGGGHTAASTEGRSGQYERGIDAILQWPFGYGMGNAPSVAGSFGSFDILTLDTYYVTVAVDLGIVGFLAYYFLFIFAAINGSLAYIRSRPDDRYAGLLLPLACVMMNFVITKSVLSQEETHIMIAILLGAFVAIYYRTALALGVRGRIPLFKPLPATGRTAPAAIAG